jgi:uncharacterized protein YndB with AHSA1/START domain
MKPIQTKYVLEVATPSDREIEMTRAFRAPRELLFDAFTKPELVRRWLLGPDGWEMPVCEIDLKVGGAFHYVWRNATDSREFGIGGVFREIDRPNRMVHVEKFDGAPSQAVTTTVFVESDGATTVTMILLYESRGERDGALESGMASGVATSYDRLEDVIGSDGE